MSIPFKAPIDMEKNEIQNLRVQNLSSDPASPFEGQIYHDSANHFPKVYNGTAFKQIPFVDADTPAAESVGATAAVGVSGNAARADHRHAQPGLATSGADGFMAAADKAKLDTANAAQNANSLVLRDANGRAQFADPLGPQDAATRAYVDSVAQGLNVKPSVKVATTVNLAALSTLLTVDGITLVAGDRVLVKNQSTPAQNGIYVANSGTWARANDASTWDEHRSAFVFVEQGISFADTGWVCTADAGGTLGTTALPWSQFSGAGTFSAANDPGVTGTGVYDNTSGGQFRFRAVKAASSKVTVALSTKDITVDVNEANLALANIGGTLAIGKGGTGATTAPTARAALGAPGKYAADVGTGAGMSFGITHGLGTTDVIVQVFEKTGDKRLVMCEVWAADANNVVLTFPSPPALNSLRVVVVG